MSRKDSTINVFPFCGERINKLIRVEAFDSYLGGICIETQLEH
jgi:hypothetical protein